MEYNTDEEVFFTLSVSVCILDLKWMMMLTLMLSTQSLKRGVRWTVPLLPCLELFPESE